MEVSVMLEVTRGQVDNENTSQSQYCITYKVRVLYTSQRA